MLNRCDFYDPVDIKQTVNCPNCKRWHEIRCKDEELVLRDSKDYRSNMQYELAENSFLLPKIV